MNDSNPDLESGNIKSMGLYHHVDRVGNEVRELGRNEGEPLRADELTTFDQLHYHGVEAVDEAVLATGINRLSAVLEVGSGIGGPARHLASTTGAAVTALELQEDHHRIAADLTARCGLAGRVTHVCGDVLTHRFGEERFDAIVSWLALYHIPQRGLLLERFRSLLPEGGFVYVEDLCERDGFDDREREALLSELFANHLPGLDLYSREFIEAGFEVLRCDDMTDDWAAFTSGRLEDYLDQSERHLRVHGEAVFETMCAFYSTMVTHFSSGKLGGLRLVARRT